MAPLLPVLGTGIQTRLLQRVGVLYLGGLPALLLGNCTAWSLW